MFMQLWSPTVIHLSSSKTYPQRNLLQCFSRWLNQPSHASLSLPPPYIKGVTELLTRALKKHRDDVTVLNKPFTTHNNSSQHRNSGLRWNLRPTSCIKFPVQILRGVILGKLAELGPEKRIFEKHQNCGQRF